MAKYKKKTLTLILSMLVCAISFIIINLLNFDIPANGNRSGNGNLAFAGYPFAIVSAILIIVYGTKLNLCLLKSLNKLWGILFLIATVLIQVMLYIGFVNHFNDKIEYLGGGPENPNSFIVDMEWVNTYTNDMYFNVYSFCTVLVLPLIISSLIRLLKKT
ncbi:hypothetical protein CHH58_06600 [Terribacillus saccharophilus]|uniref:hypothetical protein n=1 Tax=Terribacillus saccharophilus TaxID=361277 RepID=UPI000BA55673|nr:hypothetical protein [Terribacillus saccharophilus]PAF21724.1 hypothetical protein CHH49_09785 [Terribacillus saccharophilus]PAF37855.1 hypothetical protein CHH58_06600 [Terribacillus saccharophilus]